MNDQPSIVLSLQKSASAKQLFRYAVKSPTIGLPVLRRTELKKMAAQYKKMKALHKAQYEVAMFDNQVEVLKTIHKTYEQPIDWQKLMFEPAPFLEGEMGTHEHEARRKREGYRPSLFDRLFRNIQKKKLSLDEQIKVAVEHDRQLYSDWQTRISLAQLVARGDGLAVLAAIRQINPFDDLKEYGSSFTIALTPLNEITVMFDINSTIVIPTVEKSLTKTGRLSMNVMSKTKYYDLYQEFVCSCMIRIARDIFSIVPVPRLYVHAIDNQINTSTGYNEKQTVLSVLFDRETFSQLNFNAIDCSDALTNFKHNMHFVRTSGFKPVQQLDEK